MAGTNTDFNANEFRSGISFAFGMAAPGPAEAVTFHFRPTVSSTAVLDDEDVPFDPAAALSTSVADPIQVPCGVQYQDEHGQLVRSLGVLKPSRIIVTLLDTDYAKVKDCTHITLAGDHYDRAALYPPSGLFDVTLYRLEFLARQES